MQERVKTSFIPKQSLKVERTQTVRQTTFGVVNVLATALLVISIVAAGGVFVFERYVESSIEGKRASLDRAREAFQPETIKELSRLDSRLSVGLALLSQHVSPSILFDYIEKETLVSVRFKDFSYEEVGAGRTMLTMAGEARSFNAVALQSDSFGNGNIFSEVIFSNLNIDSNGNIVFDFSAVVNTRELAYVGGTSNANLPIEATVPGQGVAPTSDTNIDAVNTNEPSI